MSPTSFLWGRRFEVSEHHVRDGDWWRQYAANLRLSAEALTELSDSSKRLFALLPQPQNETMYPRPVRGVVVGSVQSGKTAHMIALTSRALDAGYKIVVILGGLKDDLRSQTARRFNTQLLRQQDQIANTPGKFTLSVAESTREVEGIAPPYYLDAHQWRLFHVRMVQALHAGRPVIAVVKKNPASLAAMRERIRSSWERFGKKHVPLLVLDDECDEASVEPLETAPIPELIGNLWRTPTGEDDGIVAYVGYTATVAANILQSTDNDLYPNDFVYLLRSPGEKTGELTFREPTPHGWYCGGHTFYEKFIRPVDGGSSLLIEPEVRDTELVGDPSESDSLKQAVRSFLVGAALRYLDHPDWSFTDADRYPSPHTMIVQASTSITDHDKWAAAISAHFCDSRDRDRLSKASLDLDRKANDQRWVEAFDSLNHTRIVVSESQPHPWPLRVFTFEQVWVKILDVADCVRVRVLNSAPGSVDTLEFDSPRNIDGDKSLPKDILSIIVGGSRLSRGLTIEGLSVSYFVRRADVPTEDTILQLSRWFGYRGAHIDYCRVFTTSMLAAELTWIHQHDFELRSTLAELISKQSSPKEAGIVLASIPHGLPTAKLGVGKIKDICFSPLCRVLNFVEIGSFEEQNECVALDAVKKIHERDGRNVTTASSTVRGIVSLGWSVTDIIEVLEALQFSRHNPRESTMPLSKSYKNADSSRPINSFIPEDIDPYAIAAYLREWMRIAAEDRRPLPTFNVGVAFGSDNQSNDPFDLPLANREITKDGFVNGGWVGRSDGWAGDQFFDGLAPTRVIADTAKRIEGAPGLLLLYVLHKDGRGRRNRGETRNFHSPMFGISIPSGGPRLRRVLLPPRGQQ
jgi:hypothetical protein